MFRNFRSVAAAAAGRTEMMRMTITYWQQCMRHTLRVWRLSPRYSWLNCIHRLATKQVSNKIVARIINKKRNF